MRFAILISLLAGMPTAAQRGHNVVVGPPLSPGHTVIALPVGAGGPGLGPWKVKIWPAGGCQECAIDAVDAALFETFMKAVISGNLKPVKETPDLIHMIRFPGPGQDESTLDLAELHRMVSDCKIGSEGILRPNKGSAAGSSFGVRLDCGPRKEARFLSVSLTNHRLTNVYYLPDQPIYAFAGSAQAVDSPAQTGPELPSYELTGSPDEGLFFVVKNFPLEQRPAVDAIIASQAALRCAPKIAFPADYRSMPGTVTVKGKTEVGIVRYERIALCVDPMKPIEPAPTDFHPTPDDESELVSTFNAYFDAFDAGNVDPLMPLRDYPPFPRNVLLQEMSQYKLQYGNQKRTVLKTSWYANPPELHNGIFGEVLFSQPLSGAKMLCGAAMFFRRADHQFLLSRILTVPIDRPSKGATEDRASCSR